MSTAIAERRRPHPSMDKRCLLSHRDLRQGCSNYGNRAKAISIPSVLFRQDGNRGGPQRCAFLATEGLIMQPRWMHALIGGLALGALALVTVHGANIASAQEPSTTLTPAALAEIAQVEAEIDRIEAQALERLAAPPDNQVQQVELLGKLMIYDKNLSVNRNEACNFCHMPETGFTGPVSELNRTTGSYPGSVRTRFSDRKPQTHAYAPLSPVLHYNPGQGDLVGGNFWDMRATGRRLGNPAAEQAQGPPTQSRRNGPARHRLCGLPRLATA